MRPVRLSPASPVKRPQTAFQRPPLKITGDPFVWCIGIGRFCVEVASGRLGMGPEEENGSWCAEIYIFLHRGGAGRIDPLHYELREWGGKG